MNELTDLQNKGKKYLEFFMDMNKRDSEMAPRVSHTGANKTALWISNTSHRKER